MGWLSYCTAVCENEITSPFTNKFLPNVFLTAYSLYSSREHQVKKVMLYAPGISEFHSGVTLAVLNDF